MTVCEPRTDLRRRILALVGEYHAASDRTFQPGDPVPVSGQVFDADEVKCLVSAALDMWFAAGPRTAVFEGQLAELFGLRCASLVNSGSSANLLALSCLTSPKLGDRLKPGDEVITVAAGFPTTVNPIIQNGLVPVFVDVQVPTYNVDVSQLEDALSPKTRAVMLAHTLGNPFDLQAVSAFCERYDLWLVEDCCDALGAKYAGRPVGTFGDLATLSFYPAHHITTGEGGCVLTDSPRLRSLVESYRDWGRDCWCAPGTDDTCGKRFDWQLGSLPCGYDHKYTYSHVGYNLKGNDLQAAVGLAQLKKLPGFIDARRRNFAILTSGLRDLEDSLILPEATPNSEPSWFGFPVAVRPPWERAALIRHLEARKIATRLVFGGNLLRQPAYQGVAHRTVGALPRSDYVTDRVFWVGLYPGLTENHLEYVIDAFHDF